MVGFIGMDNRRDRRTKNIFKRTFVELLEEKPFEKISIKDIVDKADFNRCTFYNHFKDKEDLVEEIVNETLEDLVRTISFTRKHSYDFKLRDVTIFDYILKRKRLYKLWKYSEAIPGFMSKFVETLIYTMEKNHHPLFNSRSADYNQTLIVMWAYGTLGLIVNWVNEDFSTPPKVIAKSYMNLLNNLYRGSVLVK